MSGHSKWSTIKRAKEANDAKKGVIFTKLARALTMAAKEGGIDPAMNMKLRFAVEKAKQTNMPKENIERAIEKGSGKGASALMPVMYEGFAPEGVPVIIEGATDNKNRTLQEIKTIFDKGGGMLVSPGAVSFKFERAGQILVEKGNDPESLMLELIDLGASDIEEVDDGIEVYTLPGDLGRVRDLIGGVGVKVKEAELVFRPRDLVVVDDPEKASRVLKVLEALDDLDDVQKVWASADMQMEV
jgi:YebC/PmpR family DNA-binding regulatory protein